MKKYKCPKCKSTRLLRTISVEARENMNTEKIIMVNKNSIDGFYTTVECGKCGWVGNTEIDLGTV